MQLQLTGQITGIEARNGGWFAVSFQEQQGGFAKKLSTKKPELVAQAQQLIGQWATALYNESESTNINPNNGQPYMNRFLESLSMPGSVPPPAPQQNFQPPAQQQQWQQPQPQPQFQGQPQGFAQQPAAQPFTPPQQQPQVRVSEDLREARIMRQAAGKVAAALLPMLSQEDQNLASLIRISEQLVQYFRDGVQWTTPPVQQQAPQPQAQQQHQSYEQPPAQAYEGYPETQPNDDDIPF